MLSLDRSVACALSALVIGNVVQLVVQLLLMAHRIVNERRHAGEAR
jgi:hypothetical protein